MWVLQSCRVDWSAWTLAAAFAVLSSGPAALVDIQSYIADCQEVLAVMSILLGSTSVILRALQDVRNLSAYL